MDLLVGIFAARSAAGEGLDWNFLDRWATAWGIEDRLALGVAFYTGATRIVLFDEIPRTGPGKCSVSLKEDA